MCHYDSNNVIINEDEALINVYNKINSTETDFPCHTNSSTDNILSPILVCDRSIFCRGNLILHEKRNKNVKNTIFLCFSSVGWSDQGDSWQIKPSRTFLMYRCYKQIISEFKPTFLCFICLGVTQMSIFYTHCVIMTQI